MAARAKKQTVASADLAPSGQPWFFGIRTWAQDGGSHNGFKWDLTAGARTTAPDWRPTKECGSGLHANRHGMGDWSLLGDLADVKPGGRVLGVVRYDSADVIDLDGKDKAPWMEVVLTTKTADLGTVLGAISKHRNEHVFGLAAALKTQEKTQATTGNRSAAATTGDGSAAATTGNRSAAATTGYGSAAATTGDGSAAATTGYGSAAATSGKHSVAAALGPDSTAMAGETGAIMLTHYRWNGTDGRYDLLAVFAGMVGLTYGATTLKPATAYRLNADGSVTEA